MPTPSFIAGDLVEHGDALPDIHIEYVTWVFAEIARVLCLIRVHGDLAGTCGLRPVRNGMAAA